MPWFLAVVEVESFRWGDSTRTAETGPPARQRATRAPGWVREGRRSALPRVENFLKHCYKMTQIYAF